MRSLLNSPLFLIGTGIVLLEFLLCFTVAVYKTYGEQLTSNAFIMPMYVLICSVIPVMLIIAGIITILKRRKEK